jgi:uncharacterized membrane protein YozB (DUF420 family)
MATSLARFRAHHPADRTFFAAFIAACWLGVLFGFFPASGARVMGRADYVAPLILHIHAASFVGWLGLLTTQVLLIRKRRADLHMKLGLAGFLLVPVMAYSGLAAELYSQRFYIQRNDDGLDFFILPLFYTLAFPALAMAALLFARRDPAVHKRLIVMATAVIVGAAYARWWGRALQGAFGDDFWGMMAHTFTGTNLILAAAVAYDALTRGRPHKVYSICIPVIVAGQLLCSWIYHADWWIPLSRELIELRPPLSY